MEMIGVAARRPTDKQAAASRQPGMAGALRLRIAPNVR